MGMAIDGEGRAATVVTPAPLPSAVAPSPAVEPMPPSASTPASPPPSTPSVAGDVAGTHGEDETSEQKARRLRSNSEETALILTSMMSMSKCAGPPPAAARATHHDSDDDEDGSRHSDMGEDMSGDEMDDEYHGKGKGRGAQHVQFGGPSGSKLDFLDDAGFSHRFRNESNRVKSLVTKHISIDELREHFDRPIIDVAKDFGICITLMKKICRRNGIKRWPHRQIRSLSKSIASMEAAMLSSQGPEREKYRDQILSLKLKRDSVIADPNKENSMARPKTPIKDSSLRPHTHIHAAPKLSPRSGSPATTPVGGMSTATKPDGQAHSKGGRWTSEEHAAFLHGIRLYGKDWRRVAQVVRTRSAVQTRTHAQKYLLKFAGRFPFDAEGLEVKTEPNTTPATPSADAIQPGEERDEPMGPPQSTSSGDMNEKEKETDGGDTASMSSSSHDDDTAPLSAARSGGGVSAFEATSPPPSSPLPSRVSSAPIAITVDTSNTKSSALETMAMILNSPQFGSPQFSGSYRQMAPPGIQTQSLSGDDGDVAMESPRGSGVPATLPLLPSFVIKPGTWPSQPPVKSEPAASSQAP